MDRPVHGIRPRRAHAVRGHGSTALPAPLWTALREVVVREAQPDRGGGALRRSGIPSKPAGRDVAFTLSRRAPSEVLVCRTNHRAVAGGPFDGEALLHMDVVPGSAPPVRRARPWEQAARSEGGRSPAAPDLGPG